MVLETFPVLSERKCITQQNGSLPYSGKLCQYTKAQ